MSEKRVKTSPGKQRRKDKGKKTTNLGRDFPGGAERRRVKRGSEWKRHRGGTKSWA